MPQRWIQGLPSFSVVQHQVHAPGLRVVTVQQPAPPGQGVDLEVILLKGHSQDGPARRLFGTGRTLRLVPGQVKYVIAPHGIMRRGISSQFRPSKHVEEPRHSLRGADQSE